MVKIQSKDNSLIKSISKLNKSSKYRNDTGLFVCEGVRLCRDAVISRTQIKDLLFTQIALEKYSDDINRLIAYAENSYIVTEPVFKAISGTNSPQGVLCVIKALDKPTLFDKINGNGKFLALDNIQDPSNLGAILRTCEAFAVDGVVMSADCCDIYSPKVVRASMGAVFRLPYITVDSVADFLLSHRALTSYGCVVDKNALKITEADFSGCCIAVVGNEGNGLKAETVKACSNLITIPMEGRAESLNVAAAAGIVMWEMIK